MRFIQFEEVRDFFAGKSVAIVGSGPSSLECEPRLIDSHDIVVRVNNYKTGPRQGHRTDVFYSFFGTSIRKTAADLKTDGVKLCIAKCPDGKPLECDWHERTNRQVGIDYRYIYKNRAQFWFCDTFIPDAETYLRKFYLLDRHIPTTGFAAILDVLACDIRSVHIVGYDFFTSGLHNVDEPWKAGNPEDPICHRPDLEAVWLKANFRNYPISLDKTLQGLLA